MTQRYNPNYRTLTTNEYEYLTIIKKQASDLSEVIISSVLIDGIEGYRELEIDVIKLDECVMWATKGITT